MKLYIASECIASLVALLCSVGVAVGVAQLSESDALNSVLSALGGTTGFNIAMMVTFSWMNRKSYRLGHRWHARDMGNMFYGNMKGILGAYTVRIPLHFFLLRFGISPAAAATVSHVTSSLISLLIRMWHGHRSKLFRLPSAREKRSSRIA